MNAITSFQGDHRFLSNFWPCYIEWDGLIYPTLEHAYSASKTDNADVKILIRSCSTPGEAKEFLVTHDLKPSASWTIEKKLWVMEGLLFLKFSGKDPFLTRALLATGDAELIEGNTWDDTFWGVCNNTGENNLGKLLMKLRTHLSQEKTKIEDHLFSAETHQQLADAIGITRLSLYEKMMAFNIPQKKYLGY
ncbi:MAG: NADAR family protein [Sediminibacterium sp.]